MNVSSIMAFFKNEALLKLGFLAVMIVLLYDQIWASSGGPINPQTTPTPTAIIAPTILPTPNSTEVGSPAYSCTQWKQEGDEINVAILFICYELPD